MIACLKCFQIIHADNTHWMCGCTMVKIDNRDNGSYLLSDEPEYWRPVDTVIKQQAMVDSINPMVLQAIARERKYQDDKWGDITHNPHTIAQWINLMGEELMEADDCSDTGHALLEVLQVVSVGVACLEQHGVVERI